MKFCAHQDSRERSSDPTKDWTRLAYECLGVSGRGMGWQWPAAGSGSLAAAVLGGTVCWNKYLWRISPLPLPQSTGRKHIPTHQQKVWLKIYWAWPCPWEQEIASPSVSLSHQEASISLLSFSIRGQTDENHKHRKLTNLITWTTPLSNSMKLWAMLCRATQDGWVTAESSDKIWSPGEGNGKPLPVFLPWEPHELYEKAKR